MTIRDIQEAAAALCEKHAFPDRSPAQRFRYLITEVGELSRELVRLEHPQDDRTDAKHNIGLEIYDIVWNLCDLANQLDIDLEKVFAEKAKANETRVWQNSNLH